MVRTRACGNIYRDLLKEYPRDMVKTVTSSSCCTMELSERLSGPISRGSVRDQSGKEDCLATGPSESPRQGLLPGSREGYSKLSYTA